MRNLLIPFCLFSSVAFAAPSSAEREAALLVELQRTLEAATADADQSSTHETPILDRTVLQASDRAEIHED
jgi:hypothetical protein